LVGLPWREESNHIESLAVCLRAVLARAGRECTYEELVALLGLGAAVVAAPHDTLGVWCTYARDASLASSAPLYGLRLRPLHPPETAGELYDSPEFAQHFRDSYVPLIEQAVHHGQPVLAWRGWPPPRERMWGVILDVRAGMVIGCTLWHRGQPLPMTGAAQQVYVVEQVDPTAPVPDPEQAYRHVKQQALAVWDGVWGAAVANVFTGGRAYQAWQRELAEPSPAFDDSVCLAHQHAALARAIAAARRCLANWLRNLAAGLDADSVRETAHWARVCDQVADTLEPQATPAQVTALLSGESGRDALVQTVRRACELEANAVERLRCG